MENLAARKMRQDTAFVIFLVAFGVGGRLLQIPSGENAAFRPRPISAKTRPMMGVLPDRRRLMNALPEHRHPGQ